MAMARRPFFRHVLPLSLAASVAVSACPSFGDPASDATLHQNAGNAIITPSTPVNQTITGNTIQPGTHYNTKDGATTFTSNDYLNLSGGTLHGFEVQNVTNGPNGAYSNANTATTGNGGNFVFNAPIVKLNSNVDVSGFLKDGHLGTGGNVTVNSSYLYQSGMIYANGSNGGNVTLNVSSLTMTPGSGIYAQGRGNGVAGEPSGYGGVVRIGNGKGAIDIQRTAIIDTSGSSSQQTNVIGTVDKNLISIQGGLINLDGVLRADGISHSATGNADGGKIFLFANGHTEALTENFLKTGFGNQTDRNQLIERNSNELTKHLDGWVRIGSQGLISANGGNGANAVQASSITDRLPAQSGGNGGNVFIVAAKCGIINNGSVQANGGKGGDDFTGKPCGCNESAGSGGLGGKISLFYGTRMIGTSNSLLSATGGQGGSAHSNHGHGEGGDGGSITFYNAISGNIPEIKPQNMDVSGGLKNGNKGEIVKYISGSSAGCPTCGDGGTPKDPPIIDGGDPQPPVNPPGGGGGENPPPGGDPDPGPAPAPTPVPSPTPTPTPTPGPSPTPLKSDLNGLFQDRRPVFNEPVNRTIPPLMIALGQSKMFLAKTYTPVTQEILTLALREYNRLLALGRPAGQAASEARDLLKRSGVDQEVAQSLLERARAGKLQVSDVVMKMLQDLSVAPTKQQTSALPGH